MGRPSRSGREFQEGAASGLLVRWGLERTPREYGMSNPSRPDCVLSIGMRRPRILLDVT